MRVTPIRLTIRNVGAIADTKIEINKPLLLFYGLPMAGKSTILACVRYSLGGGFPDDVIRHGEKDADILFEFSVDGQPASTARHLYRSPKDGTTKADDLEYMLNGKRQDRPVEKLRAFLNPFTINQNFFADLSVPARQRYFCELLGVDTAELDAERDQLKIQNQELAVKVDGFGDIDLTPVERVDVIALRKELAARKAGHGVAVKKLQTEHAAKVAGWNVELAGLREQYTGGKRKELVDEQGHQEAALAGHTRSQAAIARLEQELAHERVVERQWAERLETTAKNIKRLTAEVAALPDLKPQADALKAKIEAPLELPTLDTSDIDSQIEAAAANGVRYERYLENVSRDEQRKRFNDIIGLNKERLKELQGLKAAKLAEIAEASGIPKLSFDEDGNFVYEDTTASMLSTSQLIRLSEQLSAMYPEGFSMSLLDRMESLGDSIFVLVDEAKRDNRTILATVVGNVPAKVPENVGVFLVKDGKVTT